MDWLPAALGFAGTLCGMVFGYAALLRNRRKDDAESGHQSGVMLAELGYIKAGVEDVKTTQREQNGINVEILTRLAKVEASSTQAHKRIDILTGQQR